jgi:hypothetical protein
LTGVSGRRNSSSAMILRQFRLSVLLCDKFAVRLACRAD